jgi:hypothetical protein
VWRPLKTPTSKGHQQRKLLTGDKKKSGVEYSRVSKKKKKTCQHIQKKKKAKMTLSRDLTIALFSHHTITL